MTDGFLGGLQKVSAESLETWNIGLVILRFQIDIAIPTYGLVAIKIIKDQDVRVISPRCHRMIDTLRSMI